MIWVFVLGFIVGFFVGGLLGVGTMAGMQLSAKMDNGQISKKERIGKNGK